MKTTVKTKKVFPWEQLYFVILLLGLLPAVADNSLFRLLGYSELDFLFGEPFQLHKFLNLIPVFLLPIGLFIVFIKRKIWMFLGLLPAVFSVVSLLISQFGVLGNIPFFSLILFLIYKISYLVFAIKGHTRSAYFLFIVILMLLVLPVGQVILFCLFTLLFRMVYYAVTQNISLFAGVASKKLFSLSLKTLLLWSPILLFAIPGFVLSYKMKKTAQNAVYEHTFIEKHDEYTRKKMRHLMQYSVKENLDKFPKLNSEGHETIQKIVNVSMRVVRFRSDSLQYLDYTEGVDDFKEVYRLYADKFGLANTTGSIFVREQLSRELRKVLIKRFLPGRTRFQQDIALSVNEYYSTQEGNATDQVDYFDNNVQSNALEGQEKVDNQLISILEKSKSMQGQTGAELVATKERLSNETKTKIQTSRTAAIGKIDANEAATKKEIDKIPSFSLGQFDAAVPQHLTDISKDFKDEDCRFNLRLLICKILNELKDIVRAAYAKKRKKARAAVERKANQFRDNSNAKLKRTADKARNQVNESLDKAEASTLAAIEASANKASTASNKAFEEANQQAIASSNSINQELGNLANLSRQLNQQANAQIITGTRAAKSITRTSFMLIYQWIFFASILSNILFSILIVKSFLYVFARVVFADKTGIHIHIKQADKDFKNGSIKQFTNQYKIASDYKEDMYISRKYFPSGRAPQVVLPYWNRAMLTRMRNKAYVMNKIEAGQEGADPVEFSALGTASFIEWNLAEGEEVIFNYKDLVAMSQSLTLDTHISFRLSSSFFDKTLFRVAKGPGRLVLLSQGDAVVSGEGHEVKSVPMERIISWQKTTQFSVDTKLRMVDIYFSDVYLKKTNGDVMIVDADTGKIKRKTGLVRFISKFFLPF